MPETVIPPTAPVTPPAVPAVPAAPAASAATPPAASAAPAAQAAGSESKPGVADAYTLTLPKDSLLDQAKLTEVAEFAKANKLTNEAAQGILERESATIAAYVETVKKQSEESFKQLQADWTKELSEDKEYGGDNFAKSAELSKRVIDRFASDQFKKDLIESGFGNHPGFNRLMAKLGKAMTEDQLVIGGAPPASKERKSTAEVFYPNQK